MKMRKLKWEEAQSLLLAGAMVVLLVTLAVCGFGCAGQGQDGPPEGCTAEGPDVTWPASMSDLQTARCFERWFLSGYPGDEGEAALRRVRVRRAELSQCGWAGLYVQGARPKVLIDVDLDEADVVRVVWHEFFEHWLADYFTGNANGWHTPAWAEWSRMALAEAGCAE